MVRNDELYGRVWEKLWEVYVCKGEESIAACIHLNQLFTLSLSKLSLSLLGVVVWILLCYIYRQNIIEEYKNKEAAWLQEGWLISTFYSFPLSKL